MVAHTPANWRLADKERTFTSQCTRWNRLKTKAVIRSVCKSRETSFTSTLIPTLNPSPPIYPQSKARRLKKRTQLVCQLFKGFTLNQRENNLGAGLKPSPTPAPTSLTRDVAVVLLNLAALLYSGNTGATKDVVSQGFTPSLVISIKLIVGGLVLLPLLLKQKPQIQATFPKFHEWMALGELGMFLGLGTCAQAMELLTSTSTQGSVMLALYLVMVPLLEVLSGKAISNVQIMSVVGSIFGVGLMNLKSSGGVDFDMGLVWGLVSSLCFALHLFRSERLSKKVEMDSLSLGVGQLIVAGLVSGALGLGQVGSAQMIDQGMQIFNGMKELVPWGSSMLACSILFTAIPQTVELVAISHVPASQASLILTMIVIWGALQGILLRGESIDTYGIAGAAMIIASTLLPQLFPNLNLSWPSFGPYKNVAQGDNNNVLTHAYNNSNKTQDEFKDLQDLTLLSAAVESKLPAMDFVNDNQLIDKNNEIQIMHAYKNLSDSENLQDLTLLSPIINQNYVDDSSIINQQNLNLQDMQDVGLLSAPLEFALATPDVSNNVEESEGGVLILNDEMKNFDVIDQCEDGLDFVLEKGLEEASTSRILSA